MGRDGDWIEDVTEYSEETDVEAGLDDRCGPTLSLLDTRSAGVSARSAGVTALLSSTSCKLSLLSSLAGLPFRLGNG